MYSRKLLIFGAGGHAKVVVDAITKSGLGIQVIIADDADAKQGSVLLGSPVVALSAALTSGDLNSFHTAVGHNGSRATITRKLRSKGLSEQTIIHPLASVAGSARVLPGTFIGAYAVIGPDAKIGEGCIINHGAIVDHDCSVGAFSHVAPSATLGGGVKVGDRVLVGAGATILPQVSIGDNCIIGAGAVVLNHLSPGETHVGVPARQFVREPK